MTYYKADGRRGCCGRFDPPGEDRFFRDRDEFPRERFFRDRDEDFFPRERFFDRDEFPRERFFRDRDEFPRGRFR